MKHKSTYIQLPDDENTIRRFIGENAFLSNFYTSTIRFENRLWRTVEHAYQAAKTLDEKQKDLICVARTPAIAKKLGQAVIIREDWNDIKISIMKELTSLKFDNCLIEHMLLNTQNKILIEENFWNDTFWGVCRGVGQNKLGIILMEEREKRKNENVEK